MITDMCWFLMGRIDMTGWSIVDSSAFKMIR